MKDEYDITQRDLDEATCWRLLARAGFGRVGFVDDGELVVLPVNTACDRGRIIFRTAAGNSLARNGHGANVAFEADHTDAVAESGWSVVLRGRMWDVTESADIARWSELAVHPWAPPPRDRWMMIEPTQVTGRLIERHRRLAPGERPSYMPPD
jgi:nitroimidazol reductase NimA-like FMN-containing flavoprotein (pyridoxamine 5'-phosphate oxidase superfamily)